jgi:ribose transport system permease protein
MTSSGSAITESEEQSQDKAADGALGSAVIPARGPTYRLLHGTPFYIFLFDVVLVVMFTIASPAHVFWSWGNEEALMGNASEAFLLATGATVMLAAGAFDLSLGANVILSSVVGGLVLVRLTNQTTLSASAGACLIAVLVCVTTGTTVGFVNGFLITKLRVNSLIATLGTMGICTGLGFLLVHGADITGLPTNLQNDFGLNYIENIPPPTFIALGVLVFFWGVLRYSRYGMRTLAIGSNRASADRAGIYVERHIHSLMIIGGLLAGVAGFVDIARFGTTDTTGHTLDALAALTAVVVGGTPLLGGRANMFGTLWGAVLAYVILDGLIVMGFSTFYQEVATGAVLIIAVAVDANRTRRRE